MKSKLHKFFHCIGKNASKFFYCIGKNASKFFYCIGKYPDSNDKSLEKTRKDIRKGEAVGLILCREKAHNEPLFAIFEIYCDLYNRKYSKAFA